MATIRPFDALIYNNKKIKDINTVVSPPYDVISESYKKELQEKSKNNIVNIILPESYKKAGELVNTWIKDRTLVRTEPSMFVYCVDFYEDGKKRTLSGLVAILGLSEFWLKEVIPHELTFSKTIQDRLSLIKETGANFGPLFMIYQGDNNCLKLMENYTSGKPLFESVDRDRYVHRLWKVSDIEGISKFQDLFLDKSLIIADGHHRYKTALAYSKMGGQNGVMTLLVDFDDPGLRITTPFRLVKEIPADDFSKVRSVLSEYFEISEFTDKSKFMNSLRSDGKGTFGAYFTDYKNFLLMKLKESAKPGEIIEGEMPEEVKKLDITVLHRFIFSKLLGIYSHGNISFSKDIDEALDSVRSGENKAVFMINPVTPNEIKDVTSLGETMPQKSTYFYPKPLSGFVIYKN